MLETENKVKSKKDLLSKKGVAFEEVLDNHEEVTKDEIQPKEALKNALELAYTDQIASVPTLPSTRVRTLTKRAVMWLGQTCNLRCYFCYFLDRIKTKEHPENPFMNLDKAKHICKTLVDHYGNDSIDIQGGEPTLHKGILDLIRYCNEIGLHPTLITNALVLSEKDRCKEFQDAGVNDFLISVHGLGEVHDRVVQLPGAHKKQMAALKNMRELGIPFRFNCVLSKPVSKQLPQIAELAVAMGARAVNFLAFNPFEDQARDGMRSKANVPMYSEISPKLNEALDILDDNKIEANVRYLPICMVTPRHYKSMYNFQQLPYDHHEWDYASWSWTGMQPQRMRDGPADAPMTLSTQGFIWKFKKPLGIISNIPIVGGLMRKMHHSFSHMMDQKRDKETMYRENAKVRAELHCGYKYGTACQSCSAKNICDGFHGDYAALFGTNEANAISLPMATTDPKYFISQQDKVVEPFEKD